MGVACVIKCIAIYLQPNKIIIAKEDYGNAVLAVNIAAKDVSCTIHYLQGGTP